MTVTISTPNGHVEVANEVIATIVGTSTTEVAGVVGMTSVRAVKDNVKTILRQENYSKGVVVTNQANGTNIDVYVIVSYGVKITEVARNIQDRVRFNLENQLGISGLTINVYVQSVKVVAD